MNRECEGLFYGLVTLVMIPAPIVFPEYLNRNRPKVLLFAYSSTPIGFWVLITRVVVQLFNIHLVSERCIITTDCSDGQSNTHLGLFCMTLPVDLLVIHTSLVIVAGIHRAWWCIITENPRVMGSCLFGVIRG